MLQIDELLIRIPGLNEEEGTSLGKRVAEKIAASIPDNIGEHCVPELKIQLKDHISNDPALMADRIAEEIIRQIRLATL